MYREFDLIDRIAQRFAQPEGITVGIGDDAAVLDPGRFDLVTTDTLVEGVHFRRDLSSPADIGWKVVAVSLSDIAAMGGAPGAFFFNLVVGADADEAFIDGVLDGMAEACEALVPESFEVSAGGGDTTASDGPTVLSLTLLGEASPAGPITRSSAVPGDRIALLGPTGAAAAGLALLKGELDADPDDFPALVAAHRRPRPRVREGALLGLYGVPSSLIDISDGFAQDLGHILDRSKVGAYVELHNMPRHRELVELSEQTGIDVVPWMVGGGDDYELILTVPPARMPKLWEIARREGWDVYDVGEIRGPEEGLRLVGPDGERVELDSLGYQHFA